MTQANNVSYGKPRIGGAIFSAPTWAKLPTDAILPLGENYKDLGYISEDGLTNSNSPESETIKAWGGDTVLVSQTDKPDTFTFTLIESTNIDVLKEVYGSYNVSGDIDTGVTIKANSLPYQSHRLVIETMLNNAVKRIVIPNAVISEVGDIEYTDDGALGYETTIQALPDEQGNTHYEYLKRLKVDDEESDSSETASESPSEGA